MKAEFYYLGPPGIEEGPLVYGKKSWGDAFPTADWAEGVVLETISCPVTWKHERAGNRIGDLRLDLRSLAIGDFMWTDASELLITERVLNTLTREAVSGFETQLAKVETVRGERRMGAQEIPILYELIPTGRGGHIHPSSGVRLLYQHPPCGLERYSSFRNGIIVDPAQWDGSDIFTVIEYTNFILVSERVKEIVSEAGFTNCVLMRSRDLRWGEEVPRLEEEEIEWE